MCLENPLIGQNAFIFLFLSFLKYLNDKSYDRKLEALLTNSLFIRDFKRQEVILTSKNNEKYLFFNSQPASLSLL